MTQLQEKYGYDWDRVFRGNAWLIIYSITSFASLFILLWITKK